jgi:hypothetical protein
MPWWLRKTLVKQVLAKYCTDVKKKEGRSNEQPS